MAVPETGTRALAHLRAAPPPGLSSLVPRPPVLEDLLFAIEKRLLQRLGPGKPERGSKEAVRKHVGVFKGEGDLDEVLTVLSTIRGAKPGGGRG
jgi:hypothetical protein